MEEVNQPTGEELDAADQVSSEEQEHHEQEHEENRIPPSVLQAIREEMKGVKEQNRALAEEIMRLQSLHSKPQEEARDELDGLDDDDVITKKDVKRLLSMRDSQLQAALADLKYQSHYSKLQEHLPKLVERNPAIKRALTNPSLSQEDRYELALELMRSSEEQKPVVNRRAEAEKIIANANKPKSINSASYGVNPFSSADSIMKMSADDFEQLIAKVKKGR